MKTQMSKSESAQPPVDFDMEDYAYVGRKVGLFASSIAQIDQMLRQIRYNRAIDAWMSPPPPTWLDEASKNILSEVPISDKQLLSKHCNFSNSSFDTDDKPYAFTDGKTAFVVHTDLDQLPEICKTIFPIPLYTHPQPATQPATDKAEQLSARIREFEGQVAKCPIGLDANPLICSAGCCAVCMARRAATIAATHDARVRNLAIEECKEICLKVIEESNAMTIGVGVCVDRMNLLKIGEAK
jgi:hypothetical protein